MFCIVLLGTIIDLDIHASHTRREISQCNGDMCAPSCLSTYLFVPANPRAMTGNLNVYRCCYAHCIILPLSRDWHGIGISPLCVTHHSAKTRSRWLVSPPPPHLQRHPRSCDKAHAPSQLIPGHCPPVIHPRNYGAAGGGELLLNRPPPSPCLFSSYQAIKLSFCLLQFGPFCLFSDRFPLLLLPF